MEPTEPRNTRNRAASAPVLPKSIGEIPLFPLELVLFPHVPERLHIFEERYKQMIARCVRESLPFGIVLTTGETSDTGHLQTSAVGCLARIVRVERLPEGRMNIEVVGEERFRILDTHEQMPYRTGLVEPLHDVPCEQAALASLARDVEAVLRDFLTRKLQLSPQAAREFDLPHDPDHLGFLAAWVLPVENDEKQDVLANTDALARLSLLRDKLQTEVARLEAVALAELRALEWEPLELRRYDAFVCPN